jgi:hypothetical protein
LTCSSTTVALTCAIGYYLVTATTGGVTTAVCTACTSVTLVLTCSSTAALTCVSGYYVSTAATTVCTACPVGGSTCSGGGSPVVSLCLSGFYFATPNCVACSRNVAVCTSYAAPTTCNSGKII